MSKAGLWPREKPRPTESNAEIRLYEAFAGDLPVRDGRWYQNSNPLDHSLREQVHFFVKKLISRLPSVHGYTVPYGILDKIILECSQFLECNRVAVLRLVKGRFAVGMRVALSRVLVVE